MIRLVCIFLLMVAGHAIGATLPARDANGFLIDSDHIHVVYDGSVDSLRSGGYAGTDLNTLTCDHTLDSTDTNYNDITGNKSDDVFCLKSGFDVGTDLDLVNFGGTSTGSGCSSRKYLIWVDSSGDPVTAHPEDGVGGSPPQLGGLELDNADCWVMVGLFIVANGSGSGMDVDGASTDNVFHNFKFNCTDVGSNKNCYTSASGSDRTRIQYWYIPECERQDGNDIAGIVQGGSDSGVVYSELANCTDLIAPPCRDGGCFFVANSFYFTTDKYVTCGTGVANAAGNCMAAENMVDIKRGDCTGGDILFLNNFWSGNRRGDSNYGASGGKSGAALLIHSNNQGTSECVTIERNVFWNGQSFIQIGSSKATDDDDNVTIRANLFSGNQCFDCDTGKFSFAISEVGNRADKTLIVFNTFNDVGGDTDEHLIKSIQLMDAHIECNLITNSSESTAGWFDGNTLDTGTNDRWAYYNSNSDTPEGSNNITSSDGLDSGDFADYTFTWKHISGATVETITGVKPTSSIPTGMKTCDTTFTAGYGDG